jgi:hypothetical protein
MSNYGCPCIVQPLIAVRISACRLPIWPHQNFGHILTAGPARLTQFGLKLIFESTQPMRRNARNNWCANKETTSCLIFNSLRGCPESSGPWRFVRRPRSHSMNWRVHCGTEYLANPHVVSSAVRCCENRHVLNNGLADSTRVPAAYSSAERRQTLRAVSQVLGQWFRRPDRAATMRSSRASHPCVSVEDK